MCNNSRLALDEAAREEKPRVLLLTFLALCCSSFTLGTPTVSPFAALMQWPGPRRLREAGEIKPPFALRNFMHYSELQRIISPRQLLRGQ